MNSALLAATVAVALSLQSCDKENGASSLVGSEVSGAFQAMFPNANDVEWTRAGNYNVANFTEDDGTEKSAYFDDNGTWYLTDTDITSNDLPQVIVDDNTNDDGDDNDNDDDNDDSDDDDDNDND